MTREKATVTLPQALLRSRVVWPHYLVAGVVGFLAVASSLEGGPVLWPLTAWWLSLMSAYGFTLAELHRRRAAHFRDLVQPAMRVLMDRYLLDDGDSHGLDSD